MANADPFQLESRRLGALPIVGRVLARLRFGELLEAHLPVPDARTKLADARALGVLVRNLIVSRTPLYYVAEWAGRYVPALLGLEASEVELLNDDRTGRALDRLFDADRQAMMTQLVVRMVREFDVSLDQLHNDSTTLTLHGEYEGATGRAVRGQPTLRITFGHNKDHRPDLKQLLWILTVSADGAVPVLFKVTDGNVEDSTTHIETWELLRQVVGSAAFIYVADSKLCTRDNLKHIAERHGRFVTVLPRSRGEDALFRDWLQENIPSWEEVLSRPDPRRKDGPPDVFRALPSPIPDGDGFRVIWYQSTHKMERDAQHRRHAIQKAQQGLARLRARLAGPRCRLRTRAAVAGAAQAVLRDADAEPWLDYEIETVEVERYRQARPGRPGKTTPYRREVRNRFDLSWTLRQDRVAYDARCDGIFPLITNCSPEDLSAAQVLEVYKTKQPLVEKRHHLFKNVLSAVPVSLKSVHRIEALSFVLFVALLVHALVERAVRQAMEREGIKTLPLYPEERACAAPTAARIFDLFDDLARHVLRQDGEVVQRFEPTLSERQCLLLELLGMDRQAFLAGA